MRGALGQPQLRGAHPSRGEGELPRLAAARRRLRARRPDGHRPRDRAARPGIRRRRTCTCATSGRAPPRSARRSPTSVRRRDVRRAPTPTSSRATTPGARCRCPTASSIAWEPDSTYVRQPAVLRRACRASRARSATSSARAASSWLGDSVTTDHISPAGSIKAGLAGRALPRRARRRAQGLQLVRRAARQPRGDGARHVRERPPAQPARARLGGDVDGARPVGRGDDDLRRVAALPRRGHAADRARRQGVRLGLVARLGGEGAECCSACAR